jgi:hypothetical protein
MPPSAECSHCIAPAAAMVNEFVETTQNNNKTLFLAPGDKRQLKAQDVTAKLVRFDILHMEPKNILFCILS